MSLLFCDGFDHYNTGALMARKWTVVSQPSQWTSVTGRFSGLAMSRGTSFGPYASWGLSSNPATVIIGLAIKPSGANPQRIVDVRDSGTVQCELKLLADGHLNLERNGTFLAQSSVTLPLNAWSYIEWKVTIADSGGRGIVRLNGNSTAIIDFTGDTKNSSNATLNSVFLSGDGNNSMTVAYDDVYICDTSGSLNNDFLGDTRIKTVLPDGAGNYTEWSPSAGSNYAACDENPPNDDTDYVSSSTANQRDTYNFASVGLSAGSILAAVVNLTARKDDAGLRQVAAMARASGTDGVGATKTLTADYLVHQHIFETNPNTSVAWTIAGVDGAEFGHKLIA